MNYFNRLVIACGITLLAFTATQSFSEELVINNIKNAHNENTFSLIVTFKDKAIHQSLLSTPETTKIMENKKSVSSFDSRTFKKNYNIDSDIPRTYGLQQLTNLGHDYSVNFTHIRSMAMQADLIKVTSETPIVAEILIMSMLSSKKFEKVMLNKSVSKQTFNDPRFVEQRYLLPYSQSNLIGQDYLSMREQVVNNIGRKIRIGIADTGSATHEDINDRAGGYDFVTSSESSLLVDKNRDSNPDDVGELIDGGLCHDGHGLSVAGLIAAKSNNNLGVTGAMNSEEVDLIYARVLDCFGSGQTANILDAVSWMSGENVPGVPDISEPVDIINLSLGGYSGEGCNQYEQNVYDKARKNGVVVFVAAGNSNEDAGTFVPASCNNVITVGSITYNGDKASFSNWGDDVDIMAMGDHVYMISSDQFEEQPLYFIGSGTSMASPNAAAGAGNLLLKYPNLTPAQIEAMMKANGIAYTNTSICGQLGCGAGAVDMGKLMSATDSVLTNLDYSKSHRYEGYNSSSQSIWLQEMDNYINTCDLIKYTWGRIGSTMTGVEYKLYKKIDSGALDLFKTLEIPQFIHNQSNETIIAVQACQNGTCGEVIQMHGDIKAPSVCL